MRHHQAIGVGGAEWSTTMMMMMMMMMIIENVNAQQWLNCNVPLPPIYSSERTPTLGVPKT